MNGNLINSLMSCKINNETLIRQLEAMGFKSNNKDGMTFEEAMICSQISNAIRGDYKSYENIMANTVAQRKMPLEVMFGDTDGRETQETGKSDKAESKKRGRTKGNST